MMTSSTSTLLLVVLCASAAQYAAGYEHPRIPTHNYAWLARAPATRPVPITLALNIGTSYGALEATCDAVSNPTKATYGQYMTIAEVTRIVQAPQESLDHVMGWLSRELDAEHVVVAGNGDLVQAVVPAGALEKALGVEMHIFTQLFTGATVVRSAVDYVLPATIRQHVQLVLGVTDFAPARASTASRTATAAAPDAANTTKLVSPVIQIQTVTSTEVFLVALQLCKDMVQTGWPLCGNSSDPIVEYQLVVQENGMINNTIIINQNNSKLVKNTAIVVNHGGLKPYAYYQFYLTAVGKSGALSDTVTSKLTNPPPGFTGIRATPRMTTDEVVSYYDLPELSKRVATPAGSNQSVAEFGDEYYNPSDLAQFLADNKLPTDTPVQVHGVNVPGDKAGIESSMDIQLIMSVAPGVPTTFWSVPLKNGSIAGGWVLEWAMQMAADEEAPLVTSISYGLPEDLLVEAFGKSLGTEYGHRFNYEALKLCARGRSVLVCSQDAGSTDDGHGSDSCAIQPVFPATSPYVTAVGATIQCPECPARPNGAVGEAAISPQAGAIYTTGGGFSNMPENRVPGYQKDAVTAYLTNGKATLPTESFNRTGRGYPDLSAIGTNYQIVVNNRSVPIGDGTSSSTPVWSGVISLLNNARMAAGKPQLGFLNPLLYSSFANINNAIYDITVGQNNCGAFLCCPADAGFFASKGWDPLTGLGSPGDFDVLVAAAMAA